MMTLSRFAAFPTLFRDFDELFRDGRVATTATRTFVPAADVLDFEKHVELRLDLPGVKADGIEVKVEGSSITINAERSAEVADAPEATAPAAPAWVLNERSYGRFERSFALPTTLVGTQPEASYVNGVLTIKLPKPEAVLPRSVKVKVAA